MLSFKKIISVLSAVLLFNMTSYAKAESGVAVTDSENGKFKIAAEVEKSRAGEEFILYVFNPETDETDLSAAEGDVYDILQYSEQKLFDGEALEFDFTLNIRNEDDEGKKYTYIIKDKNGVCDSGFFAYYSLDAKNKLLEELKTPSECYDASAEYADKIYNYFNMQSFDLYNCINDKSKVGEVVLKSIEAGEEVSEENVCRLLRKASVIRAFSEKSKELTDKDGKIIYMPYLTLDDDYINLYESSITPTGIKDVFDNFKQDEYMDIDKISEEVKTQILVSAVYDNVSSGYGHISELISKFESKFEALGLNIADYKSANKNLVGKTLISEGRVSAEKMIERINELSKKVNTPEPSNPSGSSGSRGSKGSQGSTSSVITPPVTPVTKEDTQPSVIKPVTFKDLEEASWAENYIEKLYEKGIVSGKEEGIFAPLDNVTREEFITLIVKAFNLTSEDASADFEDVDESSWAFKNIAIGSGCGIIKGDGVNFYPKNNIKREDIAVIIAKTIMNKGVNADIKEEKDFCSDYNKISDYAKNSVQVLYSLGILSGDEEGNFNPSYNATRAEAAVIISKTMELVGKEG